MKAHKSIALRFWVESDVNALCRTSSVNLRSMVPM